MKLVHADTHKEGRTSEKVEKKTHTKRTSQRNVNDQTKERQLNHTNSYKTRALNLKRIVMKN